MIAEVAIGALCLLTGAFGTKIVLSRCQLKKLEASIRLKVGKELADEWSIEDKKQAVILDAIQLKELDDKLEQNQILLSQAERDTATAILLAEQNRAAELEIEQRRAHEEEALYEAKLVEAELQRTQIELAQAETLKLEQQNRADEIKLQQTKSEAEIAVTRKLELEEEARQRHDIATAEASSKLSVLRDKVDMKFRARLGTKPIGLYLDRAKDVETLDIQSSSNALLDILVGMDLLVSGPNQINLISKGATEYSDSSILRQSSCKEFLAYCGKCTYDCLRKKTYTRIRDERNYSIILLSYPNFDKVRWELAIVQPIPEAGYGQVKVLASAMEFCLPSKDEAELALIFIRLLIEALDKYNQAY